MLLFYINDTDNICTSSLTNLEHPMDCQIGTYIHIWKRKKGYYSYPVRNQHSSRKDATSASTAAWGEEAPQLGQRKRHGQRRRGVDGGSKA
jgi:hypothetical protein